MTKTRDKANTPLTNFESTGIDDNATSTAVTVDSSGNVGIGTTNPSSLLNILGTTADADGALGSKNPQFVITGGNTNNPLEFGMDNSGATAVGFIQSRNTVSGSQYLSLNPSGGNVGIGTSSPSQKLSISGGSVIIEDGYSYGYGDNSYRIEGKDDGANARIGFVTGNSEIARFTTSGLHIGGTGSANALSDYEEGTWTASLVGSSTNPSTPVTVTASYTKIGRYVYLAGQFSNVNTTGASGGVRITGMPFAPSGVNVGGGVITYDKFTFSGSNISPYATSTYIAFYQSVSGSAWSEITHSAGTGAYLAFGVIYITA